MSSKKAILVTGSNDGIGKALSKLLLSHHNCKVFMCSRSLDRGEKSLADVKSSVGPGADVELLQVS
jgi:NAD(P)-dependent dehydrogenase (short-subunit alcohol dehydrogenase family)